MPTCCVCVCVSDSGRTDDTLKASQLCLRLLDASSRDDLRRLLTFMAEAADPKAFQLHKTVPESITNLSYGYGCDYKYLCFV